MSTFSHDYSEKLKIEKETVKKDFAERRVLVVGGSGYIGSVLVPHLLEQGYFVRVLDLLIYKNRDIPEAVKGHKNLEFVEGDFADKEITHQVLDGVSDVVMLAGLVGDPITKKYPEASQAINERAMLQFMGIIKTQKLNKVIFVSTCSNYGLVEGDSVVDENSALKPLSLYAKAKVMAEESFLALKNKAQFSGTVLRFATAFGYSTRMRFDLTVNEFARELYFDKDLLVFDAMTWRPYCHVKDFSDAIQRVLEAPRSAVYFEVFNAGCDENNCTKEMIVKKIQSRVSTGKVSYKEHGSDPRNYKVNFKKIKDVLHFQPQYLVEDGIDELVEAFRKGEFSDFSNKELYGNYTIHYPVVA